MDIVEYKRIVVALRPSLLAVARRITGNRQDAEDAVQDVCLKIWRFRDRFDRYNNVEAYGTAMVRNLSIDRIRGRKPVSDETVLLGREAEERLPDSLLEEKEVREAIRRIIGLLPPLQQRILQMKDMEGYETGEIAEITGLAAGAVRNNLSRARKRIRELYLMYYRIKQDRG
ncbi:MAG: RNA polymerase sigma factor [Proteiniphilum sp.]|jgi:RNA polymerase sigma-70 factor (ECF subfamily)|nr:RNA polymerase sigma factor [Proteiniphilum sp.]